MLLHGLWLRLTGDSLVGLDMRIHLGLGHWLGQLHVGLGLLLLGHGQLLFLNLISFCRGALRDGHYVGRSVLLGL